MNQYLNIVRDLSLRNQQTDDYIRLCENALLKVSTDSYIEKHHILPKCICDTVEQKLDKENLVVFTAREHFEAHKLLSEMFTGKIRRKMLYALSGLCFKKDGGRILNADEYAIVKEASRIAKRGIPLSEEHKQKIRDTFAEFNPNRGRKHSEETKKKYSDAKIGTHRSAETKNKISNSLKGIPKRPFTDEHRRNIGEKSKGRITVKSGTKYEIIKCPHCDKEGGKTGMRSHHFDNCKVRKNV